MRRARMALGSTVFLAGAAMAWVGDVHAYPSFAANNTNPPVYTALPYAVPANLATQLVPFGIHSAGPTTSNFVNRIGRDDSSPFVTSHFTVAAGSYAPPFAAVTTMAFTYRGWNDPLFAGALTAGGGAPTQTDLAEQWQSNMAVLTGLEHCRGAYNGLAAYPGGVYIMSFWVLGAGFTGGGATDGEYFHFNLHWK